MFLWHEWLLWFFFPTSFNFNLLVKAYRARPAQSVEHKTLNVRVVGSSPKLGANRPFPSSLLPLLQNKSKSETFHMQMSSSCSFIFMKIKVIFIRMFSHLDSLWSRGTREIGNGLFLLLEFMIKLVFRQQSTSTTGKIAKITWITD